MIISWPKISSWVRKKDAERNESQQTGGSWEPGAHGAGLSLLFISLILQWRKSVPSGRHTTIGEGGETCAHNFNPVRRTRSGGCSSLERWGYSWTTAPSTDPFNIVPAGYFPWWPGLCVYLLFPKADLDTKFSEENKVFQFKLYLCIICWRSRSIWFVDNIHSQQVGCPTGRKKTKQNTYSLNLRD